MKLGAGAAGTGVLGSTTSGNEMDALIRGHDWSATSLGPTSNWPQSLRTLIDVMLGSNQPMFVAWGRDRTLLYNDAYAQILSAKHPEALGRDFLQVWSEIHDDLAPIVEEAYSGRAVQMDDIKLIMQRRGYAEETHFSFSYTPIRDDRGAVGGFFCPCIEITEQVLGEQRRAADAERQRQLFEQAPGFITILNGPHHQFEFANASYRRLFGDREYVGKTVREAFPELLDQDFFDLLDRVYSSGERFVAHGTPIRLRTADGRQEERFLDFIYEPVTNEAGQVTGIFVEGYDVTEAHRAQAAVRESEARFRLMADAVPQIVWITDAAGNVEFFNKQWTDYTGVPYEPTTAAAVAANHVHPHDGAATVAAFEEARRRGETFAVEHRIRSAAGEYRWFLVRAEPYRDPQNGEIVRWFGASVDIHERRQAEAALRKSEARYRTLFDSIRSGFCVVEVDLAEPGGQIDYRVIEANPAFYEQTGFSEAITHQWLRKAAPELEEHWFEKYGRIASTGTPERFEMGSNHLQRWFDVFAFPAGAPEEKRVGILFNDISERREAEEELRKSEARLRELNETLEQRVGATLAERQVLASVVENVTASIMVCDLDLNILAINRSNMDEFERIYGNRPKPGDNILELIPTPEERARVGAEFAPAQAGESRIVVDEFGAPGRERVAYEVRFDPLRDADGVQIGIVQTAYDVSERVRAQARLAAAEAARREADALYKAYFENTPEALFLIRVKPDGYYVEQINAAHEAGLGFKRAEVQGKRIDEILPAEVAQQVIETYQHVIANGEVHQYREVYDLSGNPQHWDTSLVPMRDETGQVIRLIGSSRNVTAQVFAEEALRHSQKMEAMGNLTGGVAHDFNNLLTPIIGSLDMLQRKESGDERQMRLIGGALQSAEKAKTLVQRLLAFARRQPLQPVAVDAAKLISGMAELVSSTTGPQIKVVVDAPDTLPAAKADPNQLEMAVLNLSVNARDAMPEGGTLRISARPATVMDGNAEKLSPGRYVIVSVADTGTGMDEVTLQRAVEPFFSTKGVGRGTGLGLSMAHGLAAQLGGALFIRSSVGMGTNVELWLPQSQEPAASESEATEEAAHLTGQGTVLLVDDEPLVRASTAEMLSDLGYEVKEAESAEEALRLIDAQLDFDLLITDHLMPGMTGTQLAYEVRTRWPTKPLMVISGYAQGEGVGPDVPRLTKPFRQADLAAKIAELHTEPRIHSSG